MGTRRRHPDSTGIFFMALENIVYVWVIHKTTVNKNAIMMVTSTTQSYKLQSVEYYNEGSRGWKNMLLHNNKVL